MLISCDHDGWATLQINTGCMGNIQIQIFIPDTAVDMCVHATLVPSTHLLRSVHRCQTWIANAAGERRAWTESMIVAQIPAWCYPRCIAWIQLRCATPDAT